MKTLYKNLILSFFLLLVSSPDSFSQYVEEVFVTEEDYSSFKESTLYVVLGMISDEYDEHIKKSMDDHWTFTEYEFIDTTEFKELNQSESNFFLLSDVFGYERSKDYSVVESHIYVKLKVIKGKGGAYGTTQSAAYPAIGIASTLYALEDCFFKEEYKHTDENILRVLVKNLQLQCTEIVPGKKITGNSRKSKMNEANDLIRKSPVYILKSDLNDKITSLDDIKSYYDGEVYVVSQEEYNDLILEDDDVNIVNCVYDTEQNYVRIINAKSGEVIYFVRSVVHSKYPAGVIKYHLKKW